MLGLAAWPTTIGPGLIEMHSDHNRPVTRRRVPCNGLGTRTADVEGAGKSRREILTRLATAGEILAGPGSTVSILVLDAAAYCNGASPNLPTDYLDAIDRLKPDARWEPAAAAATGIAVFTPSFSADDKWAELRHLPNSLGFRRQLEHPDQVVGRENTGNVRNLYREVRTPRRTSNAAWNSSRPPRLWLWPRIE